MKSKKIFAAALIIGTLGVGGVANAQVYTATPIMAPAPTTVCLNLPYSLGMGSTDYYTNGSVTQLQQFLVGQGYFNSAYLGTGRFGPMTARAVAQYQAARGISAIGIVGPMTRAAIYNQTCGGVVVPPTQSAPTVYWISPTSGPTGVQVSVTGFGFSNDNTILMDGMVAARNVPVTSSIAVACTTDPACKGGIRQTLTFTIPTYLSPNCAAGMMCPMYVRSVTAGNYQVSVQNSNGTSNAQTFTVTSGTNTQPLSINGLDTPVTLSIGVSGTWTVHATAGSNSGTLHYSVLWGDEVYTGGASIMAPAPVPTQTSTSFTHAYSRTGTYTPTFTVTDDSGHSASVSSTITITPIY